MNADVTICIPTYSSEKFIERTLNCARNQTFSQLKIVVSVDLSEDNTVEICRKQAREDGRIEVIVQSKRLGWSQNTNATLDSVDTEFFFIYFHDDIIEPTYVETLLNALNNRPDAASAHCNLLEFGLLEELIPANTYDGPVLRRLIEFMATQRGTTLRSMIRSKSVNDSLRFPIIQGDSSWTAIVFHMRLLAAGPAIGVNQTLYRRWQREGSLTRSKSWWPVSFESLLCGQKESTKFCLEVIDKTISDPDEKIAARYCLRLFQLTFIRKQQIGFKNYDEIDGFTLSPLLDAAALSYKSSVLDADCKAWIKSAEGKLRKLDSVVKNPGQIRKTLNILKKLFNKV